ncbi:alpha-hydroxy acid oxidase [Pelagibacteraceae bacterium]|nr:alpha-hydroxy acid oxidase [Pelagibacteraceae bacterium]
MNLKNCYNFEDFRKLAKIKLPSPIFHYIDGGSDDEITLKRNTESFNKCDLIPNVLADVSNVNLSTTVLGQKIDFPLFLSPTSMNRLYHHHGEKGAAKAAKKMGTMFGTSTMATTSIEDIGKLTNAPKLFQLYIHKDKGLTDNLIERCKQAGFNSMCLTVDTVVAGNRERDHRTGFSTPPKLTLESLLSFAFHPYWTFNYYLGKKFQLSNIIHMTEKGSSIEKSVMDYINEQFDPSMNWKDAEYCVKKWGGPFALKGVMSVEDAKKAIDIGCTAIMISNHGGRQLDGSRAPFDQLAEIVDAVGDKIEVILDGGVRRGSHVLKALALGAKACSFGKGYLFALSAGGEKGVELILQKMKNEIERNMILMGCKNIKELSRKKIKYR